MNVETDNFANHPKELLNDRKRSFTCNQCNYTGDRPGNLKRKNMFWFIMVLAHVVITLPQHPLPSRATRWFIPEKNLSVPNNVITPSHDLLISRHTCWFIQEKSFTAARIVASPAQQLVIPKITSVPIQEKNRFIVINATIQAPWHIWNDTNSSTPEKSSSAAHNVASHVQEMVISKITSGSTQEKSRSNAIYATIQALELLMWKNTSALTPERSPSNAISAIILALKLVLWIYTCANTREKSHSSVVSVISLVKASAIFGSTWWKKHAAPPNI